MLLSPWLSEACVCCSSALLITLIMSISILILHCLQDIHVNPDINKLQGFGDLRRSRIEHHHSDESSGKKGLQVLLKVLSIQLAV